MIPVLVILEIKVMFHIILLTLSLVLSVLIWLPYDFVRRKHLQSNGIRYTPNFKEILILIFLFFIPLEIIYWVFWWIVFYWFLWIVFYWFLRSPSVHQKHLLKPLILLTLFLWFLWSPCLNTYTLLQPW